MRLNRRFFRKWLESLPEGSKVGDKSSSYFCPLATYLNHKGDLVAEVGSRQYWIRRNDTGERRGHKLSTWASQFVRQVDLLPASIELGLKAVSKEQAIKVLDSVEAEYR